MRECTAPGRSSRLALRHFGYPFSDRFDVRPNDYSVNPVVGWWGTWLGLTASGETCAVSPLRLFVKKDHGKLSMGFDPRGADVDESDAGEDCLAQWHLKHHGSLFTWHPKASTTRRGLANVHARIW